MAWEGCQDGWAWEAPAYGIDPVFGADGRVADHFALGARRLGVSFEDMMDDPIFKAIIERERASEASACACLAGLVKHAPSKRSAKLYLSWLGFMNVRLEPWTGGGALHFRPHWARVMIHALILGEALGFSEVDLEALCMAAVFHDSRRQDPYLDTGHGARAAAYYLEHCREERSPSCEGGVRAVFDPRAYLAIKWHDRDDGEALAAIRSAVEGDATPLAGACDLGAGLPAGAKAGFGEIYLVFKDADGLDRVRLGVPGDPDVRFFRSRPALDMVDFARELLQETDRLTS